MNRKERRAAGKSGAAAAGAGRNDQVEALFAAAVRAHQAGQHADAEELYRTVLAVAPKVAPKHAQSLYLLGLLALQLGRPQAGIEWIGKALALNERMPEWHYNLALAYQSVERLDEAVTHYRRASALDPSDPKAQTNLGNVLTAQGKLPEAAECYRRVLTLAAAVGCAGAAWPRRPEAWELLDDGLPAIAGDALLRCLLESCPISSYDLEQFLTALRAAILGWAESEPPAPMEMPQAIEISASVAQQCFINEYVYDLVEDEAERVQRVHDRLAAALAAGAVVPPLWVLAVAAYRPLHGLPGSEQLLRQSFPDAVRRVLLQQIEEPRKETEASASIPLLTPIEDSVSVEVRRQYEENPYPRWVKPAPASPPISYRAFLHSYVPLAATQGLDDDGGVDVLIAGCGTGQHPIETARQFLGARVLAVDLSRASIAYAMRKTRELGLKQIEYAQADILKLGTLNRSFDYIESFGVLHHLGDPWQGWRALVSLLRPGGVMNIGLYSEFARQDVVRARAFIAERGYGTTVEEIRRFRQDVFALESLHPLRAVAARRDFFSTSNCRDLLFHVQEHRHTLPPIKSFLAENDLQFLGFTLDTRIKRLYATRFPDDPAMIDLDNWHLFETENPKTFAGLYQIWAQRRR